MLSILNELNENQKKAALKTLGALLILAGAGAGKTKTITYRIANMIDQGIRPEEILALLLVFCKVFADHKRFK